MHIPVPILQQATELYLQQAYPAAIPPGIQPRVEWVRALAVPLLEPEKASGMLERDSANSIASYALRLGQPKYPHMKLVFDPAPVSQESNATLDFILRVDSHDRHLHAAPGSPDAAWLESVRVSNKELGERIEAAWASAGLPTFKEFLRRQLEARKQAAHRGVGLP
jgi:hypothetical protein